MDDKSDRDQIVVEVIEKRTAAGAVVERPAHRMLHQTLAVLRRRDLPQLFEADTEFLRLTVAAEPEVLDQHLAEAAARALGEQRVFAAQLHAAREAGLGLSVLADPHVAGGDAGDALIVEQHFGGGKTRVDLDPERLGLARQIAADVAERNDEIAVIAHQRRHEHVRQPQRSRSPQRVEAVRRHRGLDRGVFAAPFGDQAVEADRIDDGAGEDMGADLGAFLHHHDGFVRGELLQPDRGGEPGRPGADNDGVEFHRLPGRKLGGRHGLIRIPVGRGRLFTIFAG